MAFASLLGASSDILQAQQLSAEIYPQSDVWGTQLFWIISVSTSTRMICLRRKGDTCAKRLARTAGLEIRSTTPWRTGISERYHHQTPGGTSSRPTTRRQAILGYSEPPTGSVSSTGGRPQSRRGESPQHVQYLRQSQSFIQRGPSVTTPSPNRRNFLPMGI
jgi:hypothetical protein